MCETNKVLKSIPKDDDASFNENAILEIGTGKNSKDVKLNLKDSNSGHSSENASLKIMITKKENWLKSLLRMLEKRR